MDKTTEKLNKIQELFCISSVCREDIINEKLMTEKEALALDDGEMEYLADKMSQGFDFWICLRTALEIIKK